MVIDQDEINALVTAAPQLYWDDRRDQPNEVASFFHCGECIGEYPENESPRTYARYEVGMMRDGGVQVWCIRHEINIIRLTGRPAEGLEYPENPKEAEPREWIEREYAREGGPSSGARAGEGVPFHAGE